MPDPIKTDSPTDEGGKSIDNWITTARDWWARVAAWWRA